MPAATAPEPSRRPHRSRREEARSAALTRRALAVTVFLVLWGLITHGTHAGSGDEPHYMMIARSLAFDGDLDLRNDYADPANLIQHGRLEPEAHALPGRDGTLRPVHDVGMPAFFAPWFAFSYWVARDVTPFVPEAWLRRARLNRWLVLRHLLSFGMMALTAALATRLFDAFQDLSGDRRLSFLGALLVGLSPPVLSHSFLFFTEILSALLALCAYRMLPLHKHGAIGHFRFGLLVGFLVLVHARNLGLAGGLALVAAATAWDHVARRAALFAVAGAALPLGVRTWVNLEFWGTVVSSPHARVSWSADLADVAGEALTRLGGLLLDQEHGLLPYAPIYLVTIAGLLVLRRRPPGLSRDLAVLIAAYMVPVLCPWLNVHGWRGGWSPAARFVVPIVPFLAIAAFAFLVRGNRVVGWILIAAQVAIDQLLWRDPRLLWNDGDGQAEFLSAVSPALVGWVPSWTSGSGHALLTIVFLTAWVALSVMLARRATGSAPATDQSSADAGR